MYKELFPTGLTLDLPKMDLEVLVHHLQQWDLLAEQMQKGEFSATLYAVHTPHIQLHDTIYSHGFLTRGEFPKGCMILAYIKTKAKIAFQNRVIEINELVITTSGDEVDYLSSGENEVFTIIVEKNLFLQAFFDYFGEPFDLHQAQSRFFIKPHMPQLFVAGITAWITFLKNNHHLLLSADKYDMVESEILKDIFECLMIENVLKDRSGFKIEKARDFLHASLDESLDSMTLANELGISQRHMERLFKSNYGITPKRYLLNLRMNAARKELLLSPPKDSTISTIALKYNFFDLNHFSKAYKIMFNELPSQTLHK